LGSAVLWAPEFAQSANDVLQSISQLLLGNETCRTASAVVLMAT
jgi:hypothetical protein